MRVAFLGLGRMGRAMARHILDGGHELTVWNRSPGRAGELVELGARQAPSVGEAVRDADAIVLMLFGPEAAREVVGQVIESAPAGTLIVDCGTNGPRAARELGAVARAAGLRYLDAPVVGSLVPAREGTLGIFVGGPEEDYKDAEPLLHLLGEPTKVRRVGDLGAGNALKTVVNLALGLAINGVGEALRLGHDLALDRTVLLDTLGAGPLGWIVGYKRRQIESGEYQPAAFTLDALAKDISLALFSGRRQLPATAAALATIEEAVAAGHSDDDFSVLAGYLADEGHAGSA